MTTPLIGAPEIAEGVANQATLHNMALRHIEAKMIRALSMIVMAPPAAVEGDSYIIPAGATGAWSGKANQIAAYIGGAWSYVTPFEGIRLWINDLDAEYVYNGAAWVANGGGGSEVADAIAAHEAAADPHAQYQKESEKGVANGYASLDAGGKVPAAQLPATTVQPYDLVAFNPGVAAANAKIARAAFARAVTFPSGLAGSVANAAVAATASNVFDIQKNGASVGSVTFGAGQTNGTFAAASAISLASGDRITIVAPATVDATLADVSITLAGVR